MLPGAAIRYVHAGRARGEMVIVVWFLVYASTVAISIRRCGLVGYGLFGRRAPWLRARWFASSSAL